MKYIIFWTAAVLLFSGGCWANDNVQATVETVTVDADLGASREGSRTDAESLSPEQLAALRSGANYTFQTEVNRVMKLIINSLYRNKEIFLRELISNASDALDKIRLLSLTDGSALAAGSELAIRVKADPERRELHIVDSGLGMTRQDLINNLGTIAKSGTADFLAKMQDDQGAGEMNDMIGQFGVGFYSAFLVAERVTVVSKHNDDDQHVWSSDANSFSVAKDPRGNTLARGTHITLHLKEEAADFLQTDTIKQLVKKYSQFINFPIYLWGSREETVTIDDEDKPAPADDDEDAMVEAEESAAAAAAAGKSATRTVWEWQLMNDHKPLWTRAPADVQPHEYSAFYSALTGDRAEPRAHVHFVAEGEVTFRALLFVPRVQPADSFNRYGTRTDHIKLYVRRVFISDEFNDLMPNYLAFVQGIVDSDDLPLNVSRETLQQHKLIKIIKKKLVRKVLDMFKRIPEQDYLAFWKEYSTNIKLGVMEDPSNRSRLAKLLRFHSSRSEEQTSLEEYVARMPPTQQYIYYVAAASRHEAAASPFGERLAARGVEVLQLTEPVDEYCVSSLPEFDGRKFQNIAKEIFHMPDEEDEAQKARLEAQREQLEPLTRWLGTALAEWVARAVVSRRLTRSPAALAASAFGWTGNMERLALANAHQKADDAQRRHQLSQKKILELNPRHPLVLELLRRVRDAPDAPETKEAALTLYRVAALRSSYTLQGGEALKLAEVIDALQLRDLGLDPALLDELADEDEPLPAAGGEAESEAESEADREADHEEL